jgi:hypothetical protein
MPKTHRNVDICSTKVTGFAWPFMAEFVGVRVVTKDAANAIFSGECISLNGTALMTMIVIGVCVIFFIRMPGIRESSIMLHTV